MLVRKKKEFLAIFCTAKYAVVSYDFLGGGGHDIMCAKLVLLDFCIIFNNNVGSATTYASATLWRSVAR